MTEDKKNEFELNFLYDLYSLMDLSSTGKFT